eukprot:3939008-Rhodomonas_salina.1
MHFPYLPRPSSNTEAAPLSWLALSGICAALTKRAMRADDHEYKPGDLLLLDNLAVAHRASKGALPC